MQELSIKLIKQNQNGIPQWCGVLFIHWEPKRSNYYVVNYQLLISRECQIAIQSGFCNNFADICRLFKKCVECENLITELCITWVRIQIFRYILNPLTRLQISSQGL